MNSRVTPKERNLLKGAIRRVFSRSELRRKIISLSIVQHQDEKRKRVKTWCKCNKCGKLDAISRMSVDHKDPIIPIDSSFEQMSIDTVVDRLWCDENNLQTLCEECHDTKSAEERALRVKAKRERKRENERETGKGTSKTIKKRSTRTSTRNSK